MRHLDASFPRLLREILGQVCFVFNRLLWSSFRFTAKLSRKDTEISPLPHTGTAAPFTNTPFRVAHLLQLMNLIDSNYHPESTVDIRAPSWGCPSCGLCNGTCLPLQCHKEQFHRPRIPLCPACPGELSVSAWRLLLWSHPVPSQTQILRVCPHLMRQDVFPQIPPLEMWSLAGKGCCTQLLTCPRLACFQLSSTCAVKGSVAPP